MSSQAIEFYNKLSFGRKMLGAFFVMALFSSLFYQIAFKGVEKKIDNDEFQMDKYAKRLNKLATDFPDLVKKQEDIKLLTQESEDVVKEIKELEALLPAKQTAFQLIGELTRLAQKFEITSVRKKMDEGDVYSKIYIEMQFGASYVEAIEYIKSIETISPFLNIEEMEILEPDSSTRGSNSIVNLVISSLLGEFGVTSELKAKELEKEAVKVRNIFASKSKPVLEVRKTDLKLQGITYLVKGSTAIVNNNVVRVGSEVGGYKVKEILPDRVVFTDGVKDELLIMERGGK
ncbi:MAG: type 4a pilus biogenesis protein PilO [Candidatus Omnitrophota bacterium]